MLTKLKVKCLIQCLTNNIVYNNLLSEWELSSDRFFQLFWNEEQNEEKERKKNRLIPTWFDDRVNRQIKITTTAYLNYFSGYLLKNRNKSRESVFERCCFLLQRLLGRKNLCLFKFTPKYNVNDIREYTTYTHKLSDVMQTAALISTSFLNTTFFWKNECKRKKYKFVFVRKIPVQ